MNWSCAKGKLTESPLECGSLMPLSPVATSHSGGLTAPGLEEDVRVGVLNNWVRNVAVLKRFASLRTRHQVVALQSLGSRQSSWPSFTVGLLNRPKPN